MASKLLRLSVTFPENIYTMMTRDAEANERSQSNQVIWVMKQYYVTKRREAEIFTPTELTEGERRQVPVFGTKDQQTLEQPSALHEHLRREKS